MASHKTCALVFVVISSIAITQVTCIGDPVDGRQQTDLHKVEIEDATAQPEVGTKNVTAHFCPYPCTVGNQTLCYPPPCPPPACVDPAKYKPTDCCVYCPNGLDCSGPDGNIIKYNHWKIVDGKNCTCNYPGQPTTCV